MEISKDIDQYFKIACRTLSTVLITGATGTGKSYLAKMIHSNGSRAQRPFVAVNLATLHEGTLESELFGHERGAFTGADQRRVGKLELANGGTIFLDEIGELTPKLQARLLEFLQSQTICPLGSNREIRLDIRVIAATHRNLEYSVLKGEFREDLYHRLRVIDVFLKTLRERRCEFHYLLSQSLKEVCQKGGEPMKDVTPSALETLENYSWPGNIRELRNVLEYAVAAANGPEIDHQHLPKWLSSKTEPSYLDSEMLRSQAVLGVTEMPLTLDFRGTSERFEKEYFTRALSRYGGRINRTAQQIGLNKATLLRRLNAYGIHPGKRESKEK